VLRQIPIGICHIDVFGHSEILRRPARWNRGAGGGWSKQTGILAEGWFWPQRNP
jgi:hypothetical protein